MRVAGHGLLHEGAPHEWSPERGRWVRINTGSTGFSTGGVGEGVCSCGASSGVLTSGGKRKDWHGDHKLDVVRGRGDQC